MEKATTRGALPEIIANSEDLYEGDLCHYFRVVFYAATNLRNPYHNFRHMCHVLYLCYLACRYYKDSLSRLEMRILLIAALFHDFNHLGNTRNDRLNIEDAIRGLQRHILEIDRPHFGRISMLMLYTEYPHRMPSEKLELLPQILRDADLAQALSSAWIQDVVFGLAAEKKTDPIEILSAQESFLAQIEFHTEWAQQLFPQNVINEKIEEASALVDILQGN